MDLELILFFFLVEPEYMCLAPLLDNHFNDN